MKSPGNSPQIPHLRPTKNSAQLIVQGKPFLMLAAELHNSSLSSAEYMSTVWQNMVDMNINTLLGSVTWEMIEPEEGHFDFSELDKVIFGAREHGMHLVLLWFGSFKNALSTYVPKWVKKDVKRFPRLKVLDEERKKKTIELVSPWSKNALEADSKAFATLMKHVKEVDEQHSTVVMVQVENETGLLGDSRDRSRIADEKFMESVPENLLQHLRTSRELHPALRKRWPCIDTVASQKQRATWEEVFGEGIAAEEMFMADAFSRYVGKVAAAGKKEYALPFYANVWLNVDEPSVLDLEGIPLGEGTPTVAGGGAKAGVYPSGGPCPHTFDIWRFNAPALDFLAPDLYLHDYEYVCQQYRHQNQPLFIPEQKADEKGARRTWLAYGTYGAMGCSPFGIDTLSAKVSPFSRSYGLLRSMSSYILEAQAERPDEMFGFYFDELPATGSSSSLGRETWTKQIGEFEVIVERSFVFGRPGPGYGMVIHRGNSEFLVIGAGFQVWFRSTKPTATFTGILSSYEKSVDTHGHLHTVRTLNGDETRSGAFLIMPNEDPDYGGFPIRVTIPARTYIAECTAYSVEESREDF
jgi:Domain of unknown function (DUF5597)/Beta-galactosidase